MVTLGNTTGRFKRIAEAITGRTADLLCAQVWVLDDRGVAFLSYS